MTISYKKLWIMLAEHEMSKAELRRQAGLSPATFTKLRRNQAVSMEVLLKIAEVMDCNVGDMMDFVKLPPAEEESYVPF
jgi:DNA-binding Xre family transcriptional regulator